MENLLTTVEYLVEHQFIASLVALPIAAFVNILLGLALANFKSEFDKGKLLLGVKKGLVVYFAIATLSGLAQFIRFADIDLIGAMAIITYGVTGVYLAQAIAKIASILNFKPSEIE